MSLGRLIAAPRLRRGDARRFDNEWHFQFLLLSRFSRCFSQLSKNFGNWNGDLDDVIVGEFDSGRVVVELARGSY